ncbi:MAG: hypothetical protein OJJ21_14670 [Ferrovibrio sp.]|uniref:hypothetical protein n=1 Tax=Ferrovibrio sp. TaxID=1917215 RepID=UPI0026151F62|nr:hypothetical protein [Ferrovibrio sp.]MCW0234840.1 hypothetical protein [Ferrovibrio sp.]
MKPLFAAAALFAVAGGIALASPAKADSFSFSYSSGGWYGQPRYHNRHGYRHHHSYYSSRHYWGPPAYYAPPPRVVVVQPPPAYYPPPPVIYAPAPYGQVSAVPASPVYQAPNGQYCREYQAGVTVNGRVQPSYGTACLMPDGAWRVVN